MKSIHSHDVMQMMIDSGKVFTYDSLKKEIYENFGEQARFHTCSAQDMDADGIIQFLEGRGKFLSVGDSFQTDPSTICNHG